MQFISKSIEGHYKTIHVIIYCLLALVGLVALGLPALQAHYIYPRFIDQLIENTETDVIRIGRNMMRHVLKDYSGNSFELSEDTQVYLERSGRDYKLWKVKIFSDSGATVYSTDKADVGKINTHPYFHETVATGQVYTEVVNKKSLSLEGETVTSDVVETYIPILEKGDFLGAFVLYYDVSHRKERMDALIARTNTLLYGLSAILVLVVVGATLGIFYGGILRKKFEDTLVNLASKDSLTGVYNRRRILELMEWEVVKYSRYQHNASLLMFDLDNFKKVNDTHGHQVGDDVLIAVTEMCLLIIRKSDLVARYGGEEFIVLLPEADLENSIILAERLRREVAELRVPSQGGVVQVTISIGVANFDQLDTPSVDNVIKLADDCLYKAKQGGRNKVSFEGG